MIIDSHTHVFPPAVRERRDELLATEPGFAAIYAHRDAAMATGGELLASMDEAGIDRSVISNFAWRDEALIDETNEYILGAAARSGGRLIPFVSVHLAGGPRHGGIETDDAPTPRTGDPRTKIRMLASAGARGIGELRPADSGYDLANSDEADILAWAASAFDLVLLFHASEPVGHAYAGKDGLPIGALYAFAKSAPGATIIAAHWGGGLPFYALMPEVRAALSNVYVDTAASHLLYEPAVYRRVVDAIGVRKVLWGSDFPLTTQAKALARTREAGLSPEELASITGGNAAELLGL
jgi:predicted TIM-barrel fold metal-dependent hydrolase